MGYQSKAISGFTINPKDLTFDRGYLRHVLLMYEEDVELFMQENKEEEFIDALHFFQKQFGIEIMWVDDSYHTVEIRISKLENHCVSRDFKLCEMESALGEYLIFHGITNNPKEFSREHYGYLG